MTTPRLLRGLRRVSWSAILVTICCAGPVRLTPMTPPEFPSGWLSTGSMGGLAEQLRTDSPRYSVSLPADQPLYSSDLSLGTNRMVLRQSQGGKVQHLIADLANEQLLWGIGVPAKASIYSKGFTRNGDYYLDLGYHGNSLVVLDGENGIEEWRYGKGSRRDDPLPFRFMSGTAFHVLFGGDKVFLLEPDTYSFMSEFDRFGTSLDKFRLYGGGTGSPPLRNVKGFTNEAQTCLVDNGLHVLSAETGDREFSTRFPTYAVRYHGTENFAAQVGASCLLALAGGGYMAVPQRGPDSFYPPPLVARTSDAFVVAAVNNVFPVDRSTGEVPWVASLDVGYVNALSVADGCVHVACTGSCGSGLYCISLEDGSPVESFGGPFARQSGIEMLPPETLERVSESDLWDRHSECYEALLADKRLDEDRPRLLDTEFVGESIVALAADSLYVMARANGMVTHTVSYADVGCEGAKHLFSTSRGHLMAVAPTRIVCLDPQDSSVRWSLDVEFDPGGEESARLWEIGGQYLCVRSSGGTPTTAVVLDPETGDEVARLTGDQLLVDEDYLALREGRSLRLFVSEGAS